MSVQVQYGTLLPAYKPYTYQKIKAAHQDNNCPTIRPWCGVWASYYKLQVDFPTISLMAYRWGNGVQLIEYTLASSWFHSVNSDIYIVLNAGITFTVYYCRHGLHQPAYINVIRHPVDWISSKFAFRTFGWYRRPGCKRNCSFQITVCIRGFLRNFQTAHYFYPTAHPDEKTSHLNPKIE